MTTTPIFDALYREHRTAGMAVPGAPDSVPHSGVEQPGLPQWTPPETGEADQASTELIGGRPYLGPPPPAHARAPHGEATPDGRHAAAHEGGVTGGQ